MTKKWLKERRICILCWHWIWKASKPRTT